MARAQHHGRRSGAGFTYIGLLILLAATAIALSVAVQFWQTMQSRAREEELLLVGGEMRRAIEQYHRNTPAGQQERYPRRLEDLLRDPRYADTRRYLRKIPVDPVTGRRAWGYQKAGELITGVYSLSDREPIKKFEFKIADQSFEGRTKYSEWIFTPRTGDRPFTLPPQGGGGMEIPVPPRAGSVQNRLSR